MTDSTPGAITPEAAVSRGQLMISGPVMAFMFGTPAVFGATGALFGGMQLVTFSAVIGFVIGWPLAWLSWSYNSPRWKVWAYRRVDDLPRLKQLAVDDRLIWPDGHLFERTEIKTKAVRDELRRLEESKRTP